MHILDELLSVFFYILLFVAINVALLSLYSLQDFLLHFLFHLLAEKHFDKLIFLVKILEAKDTHRFFCSLKFKFFYHAV